MPWSDDTRCLFCDGKLPLFRKLAQGQFCSKEHQESYWKEQDQIAVAALHRTHEALKAYKPTESIESILGPAATPEPLVKGGFPMPQPALDVIPELWGLVRQEGLRSAIAPSRAAVVAADPVEYEICPQATKPSQEPLLHSFARFERLAGLVTIGDARMIVTASGGVVSSVAEFDPQPAVSSPQWTPYLAQEATLGGLVDLPGMQSRAMLGDAACLKPETKAVEFAIAPVSRVALCLNPGGSALEQLEREAFPVGETLLALAPPPARKSMTLAAGDSAEFEGSRLQRPQPPAMDAAPAGLALATGMLRLSSGVMARDWQSPVLGPVASIEPRVPVAAMEQIRVEPVGVDPMAELLAHAGCAPLRMLSMPELQANADGPATHPVSYQAFAASGSLQLPDSTKCPLELAPVGIRTTAGELFPLALVENVKARGEVRLRPGFVALPLPGEPTLPQSKLQPVTSKQRFDGIPQLDGTFLERDQPVRRLAAGVGAFWSHAPRDLKMLLFAVPLALGLAFHPSLPKVSVQGPQADTKAVTGKLQAAMNAQMTNLRKAISERAAVGLDENFRQGLDNWMSHSGSTAEWSFDQAGFVQPGRVALYQPSLGLTDYEFQFLGAIDKGALSWVARAVDFQNYYVVKLVVRKPGPVPEMGITRYAVINGKPVDRVDTPVRFQARTDSLYRVSMVMEGDHYSLVIQGQMADSWDEPRLKRGGIGFFTNQGEQSRIGWVQITHQYDTLGRLFAYLAP